MHLEIFEDSITGISVYDNHRSLKGCGVGYHFYSPLSAYCLTVSPNDWEWDHHFTHFNETIFTIDGEVIYL